MTAEDARSDPLAPVRDALAEERDRTLEEVAEAVDVPVAMLRAVFRECGRDRDRFGDDDVAYAENIAELLRYLSLETLVRATRARARAVRSVVVNDLGAVRDDLLAPVRDRGGDPDEIAAALADLAGRIAPLAASMLESDYRDHLLQLLESQLVAGVAAGDGDEIELAVGFVDLVGYTAMTASKALSDVDEVLEVFEDIVTEAASRRDVTVVKLLGDGAMLVGEKAVDLANALLDVLEEDARLSEPPRSAGLAAGAVSVREGDYFGEPVNLAARLTGIARDGSLVAAEDLDEDLGDAFDLSRLPKVTVSGMGKRRPLRVRRG